MTPLILLAGDTSKARPRAEGRTLCVSHEDYKPPVGKWDYVEFSAFKGRPREAISGIDTVIFVGLNRAMTPGNRTEMVWEVLFNKAKGLRRISVDTTLFVSEPWRAWFHFGLVGATYRDYTYSYIAESNYKGFLDGVHAENPFSLDEIVRWGRDVIASDHTRHFEEFTVEIVPMPGAVKAKYATLKEACFAEETNPARIVDRLATFAGRACPGRVVPPPHRLFRSRSHRIVATDLGVDRWLIGRLRGLVELTDGIAGGFHGHR